MFRKTLKAFDMLKKATSEAVFIIHAEDVGDVSGSFSTCAQPY
jgi:hypothetical protein